MKICFFAHYSSLYGANRSLIDLIDGLKDFGVEPIVFCPSHGELFDVLRGRGVEVYVAPYTWWVSTHPNILKIFIKFILNLVLLPALMWRINKLGVDLIYTNSSVLPIGFFVAKFLNKPHVWHLREFGELHYKLKFEWGKRSAVKLIQKSALIISVSKAIDEYYFKDVARDNHCFIYNGVARASKFLNNKEKALSRNNKRNKFVFLLAGIVYPAKGQDKAILAMSLVKKKKPDAQLILAGRISDESYYQHCLALIQKHDLSQNVYFRGHVAEMDEIFLTSDASLMCSQNEAMGRVIVESMGFCLPVIGFSSGAVCELIQNGVTGYLVNEGSVEQLAEAMIRLANDQSLVKKLGDQAWKFASDHFSIESYSSKVFQAISENCAVAESKI